MEVFEFFFNPHSHDENYDTFCFEPKNKKERKFGNLYMAGKISQNRHILSSLANIIKKEYYKEDDNNGSAIDSLKQGLEKANKFLLTQKTELNNFNFTILTIDQSYAINLVRIGRLKTFLLTDNEILNIGEQEQINSYKIFQNIITGNLEQGNKILITTEEIFDLFEKNNILESLTKISSKEIKKNFKKKKEIFKDISGFCLLIICQSKKRKLLRFSFPKIYFPQIHFPQFQLPSLNKLVPLHIKTRLKKSLISILILVILLILGSLLFK